jgi:hypothetical protein
VINPDKGAAGLRANKRIYYRVQNDLGARGDARCAAPLFPDIKPHGDFPKQPFG